MFSEKYLDFAHYTAHCTPIFPPTILTSISSMLFCPGLFSHTNTCWVIAVILTVSCWWCWHQTCFSTLNSCVKLFDSCLNQKWFFFKLDSQKSCLHQDLLKWIGQDYRYSNKWTMFHLVSIISHLYYDRNILIPFLKWTKEEYWRKLQLVVYLIISWISDPTLRAILVHSVFPVSRKQKCCCMIGQCNLADTLMAMSATALGRW